MKPSLRRIRRLRKFEKRLKWLNRFPISVGHWTSSFDQVQNFPRIGFDIETSRSHLEESGMVSTHQKRNWHILGTPSYEDLLIVKLAGLNPSHIIIDDPCLNLKSFDIAEFEKQFPIVEVPNQRDFYSELAEEFNLERSEVKSQWMWFCYNGKNFESFEEEIEAFKKELKFKFGQGLLKTKGPSILDRP